jgi:hypothetical protein
LQRPLLRSNLSPCLLGSPDDHLVNDLIDGLALSGLGTLDSLLSGVALGLVDVVRFAEAFGARGLKIEGPEEISSTLKKALAMPGPVIVGVPVDYRDNQRLMENVHPDALN